MKISDRMIKSGWYDWGSDSVYYDRDEDSITKATAKDSNGSYIAAYVYRPCKSGGYDNVSFPISRRTFKRNYLHGDWVIR